MKKNQKVLLKLDLCKKQKVKHKVQDKQIGQFINLNQPISMKHNMRDKFRVN